MSSDSKEVSFMPKFGIVVHDNPNDSLALMEKTLDSILAATKKYTKSKIGVLMSFNAGDRQISETLHLTNFYTEQGVWCRGCNQGSEMSIEQKETELFQQLTFATYFINLKAGQEVSPTIFSDIDHSISTLKEKIICFNNNEVYALLVSAVRLYYLEQGSYEATERHIIEQSKTKGYYKEL